jgi:hypothetical protein
MRRPQTRRIPMPTAAELPPNNYTPKDFSSEIRRSLLEGVRL